MTRTTSLLLVLVWLLPVPAFAQFDRIVSSITDVAVSVSCWNTRGTLKTSSGCIQGAKGYGIELMFRLPIETADIETAVGYSEFNGFELEGTAYELRGSVRESPSASIYMTFNDGLVEPYAGIRSGMIELRHVQMQSFQTDGTVVVFNATAQAFQLGLVGGTALRLTDWLYTFGEAAFTRRRFASVQWSPQGAPRLPADIPFEFDFSGLSYSVGFQVQMRPPA
jgi:hypothetical protein